MDKMSILAHPYSNGILNSSMAAGVHFHNVINRFVANLLISTLAIAKQCHVRTAIVILLDFHGDARKHVWKPSLDFRFDCSRHQTKSHTEFSLAVATSRERVLFNKSRVAYSRVFNITSPGQAHHSIWSNCSLLSAGVVSSSSSSSPRSRSNILLTGTTEYTKYGNEEAGAYSW